MRLSPFRMPTPDIFRNYLQLFGVWRWRPSLEQRTRKIFSCRSFNVTDQSSTDEEMPGLFSEREDHTQRSREHQRRPVQLSNHRQLARTLGLSSNSMNIQKSSPRIRIQIDIWQT